MKTFTTLFLLLITGALFSQTTYHVDVNSGSNSNPGTLAQPFKTLQKAANVVSAGDTVLVHAGDYYNSDFDHTKTAPSTAYAGNNKIWGGNDLLRIINKNGNSSAYITFKPYQNDVVTLHFDNDYGVLIKNSSYIKFIGFTIQGIANNIDQAEANAAWGKYKDNGGTIHDLATELSINLNNPPAVGADIPKSKQLNSSKPSYYNGRALVVHSSHHIEILDNLIKDVPSAAIRVQKSDWTTVANNEVKNCTYWTTAGVGAITVAESFSVDTNNGVKIKLIKNYVHHNENRMVSWNPTKTKIHWAIDEGTGLFLTRNNQSNGSGATGSGTDYLNGKILIANNISAFNGASGIVCHYTNRAIIEHNTCYKNGTTNDGKPGGIGVNTSNTVDIINNIIYATSDSWAIGKLGGTLTGITRANNIVWNENGIKIHKQMASGWTKQDPQLTNPDNGDFTLQATSPAIDGGTASIVVTDDYNGDARSDGTPDVGAYEYSAPLAVSNYETVNVNVYPNPTVNYVLLTGNLQKVNTISVYNAIGRLVFTQKLTGNHQQLKIDLTNLKSGLYFIKTNTFVKSVIKK